MLSLNYDSKNDILYLGFADKNNSYGDEVVDGFVIMRDFETDEITGYTILDFIRKYRSNKLEKLPLPISVDFDKEVINNLCYK